MYYQEEYYHRKEYLRDDVSANFMHLDFAKKEYDG
jgi:hypothetical protein